MKISRETYEHYFIDYLEGNLSDDEIKILIDFLDQNPDLEDELRDITSFSKQQAPILNFTKSSLLASSLKKENIFEENESNFEDLCISFYEGALSDKEEQLFLELAESREDLMLTFENYAHTKAKSDLSIIFPNKSTLKKQKKILWQQYISYAASIIFILGFVFYISNKSSRRELNTNTYSQISSEKKIEKHLSEKNLPLASQTKIEKPFSNKLKNKKLKTQKKIKIKHKISPVTYREDELNISNEQEEQSPLIHSRKGKLAYSNLSELELHLSKIFKERKIDDVSFSQEINQIKGESKLKNNDYSIKQFNNPFQLAISIDPIRYKKQILGSQPVE
jgi:hypothetical protein